MRFLIFASLLTILGCSGSSSSQSPAPIPTPTPIRPSIVSVSVSPAAADQVFGQPVTLSWVLSGPAPTKITVGVWTPATNSAVFLLEPAPGATSIQIVPSATGGASLEIGDANGVSDDLVNAWEFYQGETVHTYTTLTQIGTTFTASITPAATGRVTFMEGSTILANVISVTGTVSYTPSVVATGTITAVYEGDGTTYLPSISNSVLN